MTLDDRKAVRAKEIQGGHSRKARTSASNKSSTRAVATRKPDAASEIKDALESQRRGLTPKVVNEPQPVQASAGTDSYNAERSAARDEDMLHLLQEIALGRVKATALQVRAAIAAVQYTHCKMGEGGKKAAKAAAAKRAAGKFTSLPPPKLVVNNGR